MLQFTLASATFSSSPRIYTYEASNDACAHVPCAFASCDARTYDVNAANDCSWRLCRSWAACGVCHDGSPWNGVERLAHARDHDSPCLWAQCDDEACDAVRTCDDQLLGPPHDASDGALADEQRAVVPHPDASVSFRCARLAGWPDQGPTALWQ